MTARAALAFVKRHGIVLESARGPVPNLAEAVVGGRIRGSWWGHAKGKEIFWLTRAVRDSKDVLVCHLVGGKITYVHRRLWPALVRLADQFDPARLVAIREIHTASGKHKVEATAYPKWVPSDVMSAAAKLTAEEARNQLSRFLNGAGHMAAATRLRLWSLGLRRGK